MYYFTGTVMQCVFNALVVVLVIAATAESFIICKY